MKRRLSAMQARKRLGEVLEGVYYRGDEVVIERAGKPMAVVVPTYLYDNIERGRDRMMEIIDQIHERTKDIPVEEIEVDIEEAIREVRAERRSRRSA